MLSLESIQSPPSLINIALLLVVTLSLTLKWWRSSRLFPYPPGPRPIPLLGNIFDIPIIQPWLTYALWEKQSESNILHAEALGQHIIIINSLDDAIELFDKRSHIYSDRPRVPVVDFLGFSFSTALMPYGAKWRSHRRTFQQGFRKAASLNYQPIQTRKIREMLHHLLLTPEEFVAHTKTVSVAIIMAVVYGHNISSTSDYFVTIAEKAVDTFCEAFLPGASYVNTFPFLRYLPSWVPGATFIRTADECRKLTDSMQNEAYNFVKENMRAGTGAPSLVAELLELNRSRGGSAQDEENIKMAAATAYAGGADTTVSALVTFFNAMVSSPEVQRKAQEEIDRVIGTDRLPEYEDRKSLPYVEAIYREVVRWRPVSPLGIPHAATIDDVYKGYFIPKGSTVIGNIWTMLHDDHVYTHPECFMPERFFDKNGQLNNDDVSVAFGFGRRVCPGRHLASSTVWLVVVSVLAAFRVSKAENVAGVDADVGYSDGLISHARPFQCSITPRSTTARRLIQDAVNVE